MTKKWYNYFVSVDDPNSTGQGDPSAQGNPAASSAARGGMSAAQTVAEIASNVSAEPKFTSPVSNANSFDEIYQAAEIPPAPQGYSIMKVADMLQSEHIRTMPGDVKRSTVLVALDAAGVDIKDVIQDAVRRDKALDGYERVQERSVAELETRGHAQIHTRQRRGCRAIEEARLAGSQARKRITELPRQSMAGFLICLDTIVRYWQGEKRFILTAIDGQVPGGDGVDKFRIKIWDKNHGNGVVYDNMLGAADGADPTGAGTVLGGGSITIHR
jgi:hypothetical protein